MICSATSAGTFSSASELKAPAASDIVQVGGKSGRSGGGHARAGGRRSYARRGGGRRGGGGYGYGGGWGGGGWGGPGICTWVGPVWVCP
jgi:uncharacterized membrane protein